MSEVLLAGVLNRETEFVNGLTGACGPNAAHTCVSWANGGYVSTYSVYRSMHAHVPALCDANGVSNIGGLNAAMGALGLTVGRYQPYAGDYFAAWRSFIIQELNAGRIVLIEMSNAQALRDYISGKGENARGLRYHFIAIVGYNTGGPSQRAEAQGKLLPNGWWAADGDNFASGNVLQFYPDSVLNAASPCCALSVNHRNGPGHVLTFTGTAPVAPVKGSIMIPAGWKDNGTTLTAPNGVDVRFGFRQHIVNAANWPAALVPLGAEYQRSGHDAQDFALTLEWVNNNATESDGPDFYKQAADLKAQLAAAQAQLAQATQHASDLQSQLDAANAEITALKNQPAPAPVQVPVPTVIPGAAEAIAYVKALKQAKDDAAAVVGAEAAAFNAVQ